MPQRVTLLAAALFALSALAGAATAPSPAWLLPAPNSSVEKPDVNAKLGKAPLGAIFQSACSQGCLQDETACFNGCGGDHSCNVNCSNDYYCCLDTCDPSGPQCP